MSQHANVNPLAFGVSTGGNTAGNTGTFQAVAALEGLGAVSLVQATGPGVATVQISVAAGAGGLQAAGVSTMGNSAGNTGTYTGTVVFAAVGGISASVATAAGIQTVSFSAANPGSLPYFEPFAFHSTYAATYAPQQGSIYLQPFMVPAVVGPGRLNFLVSCNAAFVGTTAAWATSATGEAGVAVSHSHRIAIYSLGLGASSTQLEMLFSTDWNIVASIQALVTASTDVGATTLGISQTNMATYIKTIDSAGNVTMASTSVSATLSTTGQSSLNSTASITVGGAFAAFGVPFSGSRMKAIPFVSSLTPGNYWLAHDITTSLATSGTSNSVPPFSQSAQLMLTGITAETQFKAFGNTAGNQSSQIFPGVGKLTNAWGAASYAFSDVQSRVSYHTEYFNIMKLGLTATA